MLQDEIDNYMLGTDNLFSGDYGSFGYWANQLGGLLSGGSGSSDKLNLGSLLASGAGGVAGLLGGGGGSRPTGYQGKVPKFTATREQVPYAADPNRRPGSAGRRYFTDMVYTPVAPAEASPAAPIDTPAGGGDGGGDGGGTTNLEYDPNQAGNSGGGAHGGYVGYAQGGLMGLAQGGSAGYYLGGKTDGMADKVPAVIDDTQPAKLGHGEFVVPADVVGFLGSGNSEAGADVLYKMMDRIRQNAHGNKKQIKPANLKKTLPA